LRPYTLSIEHRRALLSHTTSAASKVCRRSLLRLTPSAVSAAHRARLLAPLMWWFAMEMFWQSFFYLALGLRQGLPIVPFSSKLQDLRGIAATRQGRPKNFPRGGFT